MDPENVSFRADGEDPTPILVKKLEDRIDSQEALIANLMMAYVEVWAAVEQLTANFLETRTPEEQQKFLKDFREFRSELIKNVKQASEHGLEGIDADLLSTMESMVTGL